MNNKKEDIVFETSCFERTFENGPGGLKTVSFMSKPEVCDLFKAGSSGEGAITLNGKEYILGGSLDNSFEYIGSSVKENNERLKTLEISFAAKEELLKGVLVKLIYEAPNDVAVLMKSMRVENSSGTAVTIDGMEIEAFTPKTDGRMSLLLENDYVRGAMTVNGENARSPWIEHQPVYVEALLNIKAEPTGFAYPVEMDRVIEAGGNFNSFKVYEFIVPADNEELRGIAFRRATRNLFPWTCIRYLNCAIPPAINVDEYYRGIESAAAAGYEAILLSHSWIEGELVSPLFTNYSDYELRSELFPNGWEDVRKLTDFAHSKGLAISFYTIYVNTWDIWRKSKEEPKVCKENDWELIWAEDDTSCRWGGTLDPATGWGLFINRKMEEAIVKGGFDSWHLDGPYYGDICVAQNRDYKPGGPNQVIAWERQVAFYQKMVALGIHGEGAQGFCAYPHGMSRITTTGYDEGDFGNKTMRDQILAGRKGAYAFTKVYRPEQSTTVIPVVAWSPDPNGPSLEPMEEKAELYDAYLGCCFGYGFEGKVFQRLAFEGPKSKAAIDRWLGFWKDHADFFKKGYLIHLREPDGRRLDAIAHVLLDSKEPKILVVAYNPTDDEQSENLQLPLDILGLPEEGWVSRAENNETQKILDGKIHVVLRNYGATWYEMQLVG